MPRVVPSQVRAVIKRLYSDVETELSQKGATFPISKAVVRAIVELLNDVPAELITLEADDYANFSVNLSALRVARDSDHPVFGVGNTEIVTLPESDHTPLRVIYDLLAKCRDQAPTAGTSGLEFIIDFALRGDLRTDLSAAYSALMNHEYKAATVLAGSVVEGLLLWALEKEGDADLRQTAVTAKVKVPDDALN